MRTNKGLGPIAIILLLAALIGGGYLVVGKLKVGSFKEEPKEQAETIANAKDWKTYRNEEYGFEFQYPVDVSVSERKGSGWLVVHLVGSGYELYFQTGPKQSPLPDTTLFQTKEVSLAGHVFQEGLAAPQDNLSLGLNEAQLWVQFTGVPTVSAFAWLQKDKAEKIILEIRSILDTLHL